MGTPNDSDEKKPMYWATVRYKMWVKEMLSSRGWSLREFAERLTKAGADNATSGGISQFLGKESDTPIGSNTTLVPYINQVLGIPPPQHHDPTDPLERLRDLFASKWDRLTSKEKDTIAVQFGLTPDEMATMLAEGTQLVSIRKPTGK
jgi:hypothetical protein